MIGFYAAGAMGQGGITPPPPDFPSDIAGLIIHLDASSIVGISDGAALATWPDSGPNGYDLDQATSERRPLFRASAIGGRPAVEFDGANDNMAVSFGTTYSQPNTVFIVGEFVLVPSANNFPWMDGHTSSNRTWVGSSSVDEYAIWAGDPFLNSGVGTSTNPVLVRGVYNGASSSIAINSGTAVNGSTGSGGMSGIKLAARYDNSRPQAVKIAEVVAYNAVLSGTDIGRVESYLRDKYSL